MKLTSGQLDLLRRLHTGEQIVHSQDGDRAWLTPSGYRLDALSVIEFARLRGWQMIESDPSFDWDEAYRFGPNEVITEAGRLALAEARHGE